MSNFDVSKVGTGEGAQVHGHGLYFTEHEGVARDYRDNIRDTKLLESIRQRQTEIVRERDKIKEFGALFKNEFPEIQRYEKLEEEYNRLAERRHAPGHMYEVNINADHEKLLDWDKPLKEHSQVVGNAVCDAWKTHVSPET